MCLGWIMDMQVWLRISPFPKQRRFNATTKNCPLYIVQWFPNGVRLTNSPIFVNFYDRNNSGPHSSNESIVKLGYNDHGYYEFTTVNKINFLFTAVVYFLVANDQFILPKCSRLWQSHNEQIWMARICSLKPRLTVLLKEFHSLTLKKTISKYLIYCIN